MHRIPCVYLFASKQNGTLYVGVTSNLPVRIAQHKAGAYRGFSHKYGVDRLVWYEVHETMEAAITREKQIKKWNRAWKIRLIMRSNETWKDLYPEIV